MTTKKISELPEQTGLASGSLLLTNPDAVDKSMQMRVDSIKQNFETIDDVNIYVEKTGDDSNDGLSVGTAFATLERATKYAQTINLVPTNQDGLISTTVVNVGVGTWDDENHISVHFHRLKIVGSGMDTTTIKFKNRGISLVQSRFIIQDCELIMNDPSGSGRAITTGDNAYTKLTNVRIGGIGYSPLYASACSTLLGFDIEIVGTWSSTIVQSNNGSLVYIYGVMINTDGGLVGCYANYNSMVYLVNFDITMANLTNIIFYAIDNSAVHFANWGTNKVANGNTSYSYCLACYRYSHIYANGIQFNMTDVGGNVGCYAFDSSSINTFSAGFSPTARFSPARSSGNPSYGNNHSFIGG